ncbi:MAG: hypothetical protein OEX07_04410 [Gammaproteobacteria bacterium]|nr:hypothetical protein [Gammaproteobacteria bacterium]
MLVVRDAQIDVFSRLPRVRFEDQLITHFTKFYPVEAAELGVDQLKVFTQLAIERAKKYGITSQRDVSYFASIMFSLGSYFDEDPQFIWTGDLLNNKTSRAESIDLLFEKTIEYLEDSTGPDSIYLVKAMIRIRGYDMESLCELEGRNIEEVARECLINIYPEKCQLMGDELLNRLIKHGVDKAEERQLYRIKSRIAYITLMFMLGAGFDKDPLYPWANEVIDDQSIVEEDNKTNKLFEVAVQHINHSLKREEAVN